MSQSGLKTLTLATALERSTSQMTTPRSNGCNAAEVGIEALRICEQGIGNVIPQDVEDPALGFAVSMRSKQC